MALCFGLVMSFVTVPTPLYGLYRERDGFGTFTVTLIFAAYGVGVMLGLYLAGHLSDHHGRRRVVLAVVSVELLSAVLFALLPGTVALLALRLLSGLGIGALTAAATAYVGELYDGFRPGSDGRLSGTVATAVNTGGLAFGPLLAGLLSQLAAPLVLPYLVYAALLAVVAAVVWRAPETVPAEVRAQPYRYRPQRVGIDEQARPAFAAAAVAALAGFAVLGFVTALTGQFLSDTLHETSRLLIGTVAFVVLSATAVAQVVFARLPERRRLQLGATLVVLGMATVATAGLSASLVVFVVGGVLAAGGVGLIFQASVATASRLAAPERRSETLAAMFLAAYVGITVPVVALGAALSFADTVPVLVAFSAVVAVTVPVGILRLLQHTR